MTWFPFFVNGTCVQTQAPRRLPKCATITVLVSPSHPIVRLLSTSVLNALMKFIGLCAAIFNVQNNCDFEKTVFRLLEQTVQTYTD